MRRRPYVLIVEDDAPLRRLYRTALSLAGFDVREVADGYAALQAIDESRPDLIVLDLLLPGVNGFAVREELKAQAHTRDLPVVIVTGTDGMAHYELDANCVLRKPVTPDRLVATVWSCPRSGTAT